MSTCHLVIVPMAPTHHHYHHQHTINIKTKIDECLHRYHHGVLFLGLPLQCLSHLPQRALVHCLNSAHQRHRSPHTHPPPLPLLHPPPLPLLHLRPHPHRSHFTPVFQTLHDQYLKRASCPVPPDTIIPQTSSVIVP